MAEAGSMKFIETIGHNQLENQKLIESTTLKVQDMVKNSEEAKSTGDIRVLYVTSRNELLKHEFDDIWTQNESLIFNEAKSHYTPIIRRTHDIVKDSIDELLFGLQKIARNLYPDKECKDVFDVSQLFEKMQADGQIIDP